MKDDSMMNMNPDELINMVPSVLERRMNDCSGISVWCNQKIAPAPASGNRTRQVIHDDNPMKGARVTFHCFAEKREGVKETRMNSHELRVTELLMAMASMMVADRKYLDDRLQRIEGGSEAWNIIRDKAMWLETELEATGTDGNRKQICAVQNNGRFKVELNPVIKDDPILPVRQSAVIALMKAGLKESCAVCMLDSKEAEKCKLYRAIVDVMPPVSFDTYQCPYSYIDYDEDES